MQFRLATMPGGPGRPNEDFAGALGNCAVLFDGSGAPGDLPTGCIHGVPWFVRQLGTQCLAGMVTGNADAPLDGILALAITGVAALHRDTCDLECPRTPSSMVIMARAGPEAGDLDWLVLGDSALVIEHASGRVEVITDRRVETVAAEEFRAVLELPIGTGEHQAARVAYVRRQQPMRNKPGGYPVASTDPGAAVKAITGHSSQVRRAAMVSDGVARFAEFGLGTWGDLLEVLALYGPGELVACIRDAEDGDPEGRKWPRAKKHDDAGIVLLEDEANPAPARERRPVVAAIVTSPAGVLVGRRNDGKPPYTFIAGEQESGERPEDTAIREVKEETGAAHPRRPHHRRASAPKDRTPDDLRRRVANPRHGRLRRRQAS